MGIPLRVLIAEDSEDDTLLLVRDLKRGGYEVTYQRIDTPEALEAALEQPWDIVVADYVMPRFSGLDALQMLKEKGIDLPFIIVSGQIGEATAVDAMKAGAHDYIMKGNLARLLPAVDRELREAVGRRERRKAEEALRRSEASLAEAQRLAHVGSYEFDVPDGEVIWSDETFRIFRLDPAMGPPSVQEYVQWVHPDDRQFLCDELQKAVENRGWFDVEYRITLGDGTLKYLHSIGRPVLDAEGSVKRVFGTVIDITERRVAELKAWELEAHRQEFLRRTISAATGGKLIITERGEILALAGPAAASWEIREPKDVGLVRDAAAEIAVSIGMDEEACEALLIGIGEAGTNALKHGGGGSISLHHSGDQVMLVVQDHGPGIETLDLPSVALVPGYSTAGTLGMGYKLMLALADRIYLATGPDGTTVAMEIGLHRVTRLDTELGLQMAI